MASVSGTVSWGPHVQLGYMESRVGLGLMQGGGHRSWILVLGLDVHDIGGFPLFLHTICHALDNA